MLTNSEENLQSAENFFLFIQSLLHIIEKIIILKSLIQTYPWLIRPWTPGYPFSPISPWAPTKPIGPGRPRSPFQAKPRSPISPWIPKRPDSPTRPGFPLIPFFPSLP